MQSAKSRHVRRSVTLACRQGRFDVDEHEDVGRAVAYVLVVVAARFPGSAVTGTRASPMSCRGVSSKQTTGRGDLAARRKGEDVFHSGDELRVDLGNAPHLLLPGLELHLAEAPPNRSLRRSPCVRSAEPSHRRAAAETSVHAPMGAWSRPAHRGWLRPPRPASEALQAGKPRRALPRILLRQNAVWFGRQWTSQRRRCARSLRRSSVGRLPGESVPASVDAQRPCRVEPSREGGRVPRPKA